MAQFGIRPSQLRKPARFEMKGVSSDPEKPHILLVHHMGVSNPAVMNALLKGEKPAQADAVAQLVERGGITWENVAHDGEASLEPTTENVAAYLRACIEAGYGQNVLDLWAFAYDAKNFAASSDAVALGEALPPG